MRVLALAVVIFERSGICISHAAADNSGATVYHQVTEREEFFVPCVDPDGTVLYNILITYNYVSGTANGAFVGNETGTITAWPPDEFASLPRYTGHFRFAGISSSPAGVRSFTSHMTLFGSDGSAIMFTSVEHINAAGDGVTHELSFEHC